MTILTKIQNTRSSIKNYIIPFLVVLTLYIIFHIPFDDFLYTTANRLQNDIILFWLFIAATTIVYIFGFLIWLEYKNKCPRYHINQKLRKYKYTLKALVVIGGLCTVWRILHFYPTFNNPQINFDDWCYIGIAASLCINAAFLLYISWLYGENDNTAKTDTDKKEIKADSVETAVVEIEGKNDPNEPFIIARNGLKSVIDRVYSNDTANMGNESYIIGVNGEWGSGKSTLIELVKRQMKDDVHIIDFNPWTSHQPANLPVDFFRTIAASIGSLTMRRTIVHYGLALTKIAKKDIGNVIETLFGERSLDAQLKDIGDYIKHRNLKLLIIIDDIDRMDSDEILAVLKLACRSGNLPNTVYLLAFNHDYVEAQICQKIKGKNDDGNDSFNYIDKIVNLPFDVPKYKSDDFVELLKKAMPDSASQFERDNFFLPEIVKERITNFRAYKKIYNKIIVQYNTYKDHIFLNDFIVLKTLQIYDIDLYKALIDVIVETRKVFNPNIHPSRIMGLKREKGIPNNEMRNLMTLIEENTKLKGNDEHSLIDYIRKTNYGSFIRRRLVIAALKIDQNSPIINDDFDTLEFDYPNFEKIKEKISTDSIKKNFVYNHFKTGNITRSDGLEGESEILNVWFYFLLDADYYRDIDSIINILFEFAVRNHITHDSIRDKLELVFADSKYAKIQDVIINSIKNSTVSSEYSDFIKRISLIS